MQEKSKRLWLRYSLRTLLITVTVLCIWLGWQVNIVWQRRAMRDMVTDRGGTYLLVADSNPFEAADRSPLELSFVQRKLGDELMRSITLPPKLSDEEKERIRQAFPEAIISTAD